MVSHHLNQCWNIVSWTLRNKLQWNLNHNLYIFIQENAFQNVVWKMVANVLISWWHKTVVEHTAYTVYPKKYAHGFCFAVLCYGYTLTDFPISIRLTSLALWQSNDCPSASKATLMNMDKYFMWIHYEWLHNHNKAKHNKTACIFLGIYCTTVLLPYACTMTKGPFILQIWGWCHHEIKILW